MENRVSVLCNNGNDHVIATELNASKINVKGGAKKV